MHSIVTCGITTVGNGMALAGSESIIQCGAVGIHVFQPAITIMAVGGLADEYKARLVA